MKICPTCKKHFDSALKSCPGCGASPALVDGFAAYAPEYSHEGGGFKAHYFAELAQLEENNFWFRSRNHLITWAIRTFSPDFCSFLEIGCGTGYVLSGIREAFPHATLHGSEIFTNGLGFAAARLPQVDFMQMDANNIPFRDEFDVIGAFDVLEHIETDRQVLDQIHSALRPGGTILITVPQHKWLWSSTDDYACHIRRYTATDLHQKIESAGFSILKSTSFVSVLLPAMMFSRLLRGNNSENSDATAELKIPPWLNSLFYRLLKAELVLIRNGLSLPVGGSRLVVAKKF